MNKLVKAIVWIAGILVVVGVILRLVAFKVWKIPDDPVLSASVAPTLVGGDTVLLLTRGTPHFGDLVRCPDPENPTRWVVGRIAGTAGDVVEVNGRMLTVNNTRYDSTSSCKKPRMVVPHPSTGSDVEVFCEVVEMGGGWHYRASGAQSQPQTKTRVEVPPGMVFLLSDNRLHHDDSTDFGVLPASSCKERIVYRLWSKAGWKDDEARMTYIH